MAPNPVPTVMSMIIDSANIITVAIRSMVAIITADTTTMASSIPARATVTTANTSTIAATSPSALRVGLLRGRAPEKRPQQLHSNQMRLVLNGTSAKCSPGHY